MIRSHDIHRTLKLALVPTLLLTLAIRLPAVEVGDPLLVIDPAALPDAQPPGWELMGASWGRELRAVPGVIHLAAEGGSAALSVRLPLDPALTRLTLEAEIADWRAEGGEQPWHSARIKLRFIDPAGGDIGRGEAWDAARHPRVAQELAVPANAVAAELAVGLWRCSGFIDLAMLRLSAAAVDAADPRRPQAPARITRPEAPWPVRPAAVDESAIARSIHVAPAATGDGLSADTAAGLERGIALALESLAGGTPTRLQLAAGDYELEALELGAESWSGKARATLLVIAGDPAGGTRLLGSRRWSEGWEALGADRWRHRWQRNFGDFRAWNQNGPEEPVGWRREIVFAQGMPLRQVMSAEDLLPGSYLVEEGASDAADGWLTVQLAPGADPVALRIGLHPSLDATWDAKRKAFREPWPWRALLAIEGKQGLVLRDLEIAHAVTNMMAPALKISGCSDVLLERCHARFNGGIGAAVAKSERVTLRGCAFDDNGSLGASAHHVRDLLLEDCSSSRNNWRGDWGRYWRYAVAGIKLHYVAGLHLRRHVAEHNLCDGIWLDLQNHNVLVEDCRASDNLRFGLFHEVCWGGARFLRCEFARNVAGLVIKGSYGGEIRDCHLHDNASQLTVIVERRTFVGDANIKPLERWDPVATDWLIAGNRIVTGTHGELAKQRKRQWPPWQAKYVTGEPQHAISFALGHDEAKRFLETARFTGNVFELAPGSGLPGPTGWHAHPADEFGSWQQALVAGAGAWPPQAAGGDRDAAQVDDAD